MRKLWEECEWIWIPFLKVPSLCSVIIIAFIELYGPLAFFACLITRPFSDQNIPNKSSTLILYEWFFFFEHVSSVFVLNRDFVLGLKFSSNEEISLSSKDWFQYTRSLHNAIFETRKTSHYARIALTKTNFTSANFRTTEIFHHYNRVLFQIWILRVICNHSVY